jgi:16S rRNA (guanine1207-N2)-methyltransferase
VAEHYFTPKPTSKIEKGLIRCTLRGHEFEFLTSSGVFSHKKIDNGTRILVETMILPNQGNLLDLGCGYGPVGIVAAKINPSLEVWMTDSNSRAIELSQENIKKNGLNKINVAQGDLYQPVKNQVFDTIISNPPISAGMKKIVEPLVKSAPTHLKKGGSLQVVIQSNKGAKTLCGFLTDYFGEYKVLEKKSGYTVFNAFKQ